MVKHPSGPGKRPRLARRDRGAEAARSGDRGRTRRTAGRACGGSRPSGRAALRDRGIACRAGETLPSCYFGGALGDYAVARLRAADRSGRRRGVGLHLVRVAVATAFGRGNEVAEFQFDPNNRSMLGLVRAFGARVDATRDRAVHPGECCARPGGADHRHAADRY